MVRILITEYFHSLRRLPLYSAHWKEVFTNARVEPSLANADLNARYQFERVGYFCVDYKDSALGKLVFNRTVTLRDSWGGGQA